MNFKPIIEFPLYCERPCNPYKWVPLRKGTTLTIPNVDSEACSYLYTFNGEEYFICVVSPNTPISLFQRLPFTHWFSKPLNPNSRITNHDRPLVMDDGTDYLVITNARTRFISTSTVIHDMPPVSVWSDDKDLFPIR